MLRRRRPLSATGLVFVAAAAAVVLTPTGSWAQTPIPDNSLDLLQPSLSGNPVSPPRFRRPGEAARPLFDQAPPSGTFTAPSRIGATPIYGSPTGFGAGDIGYDSKNRTHRQRQAQTPGPPAPGAPVAETTFAPLPTPTSPAVPPKPPMRTPSQPPAVYPAKAAARPGAVLPPLFEPLPVSNPPPEVYPLSAANRPGAFVPVPPPLNPDASAATPPPGTLPPNTLPLGTVPQRLLPLAEGDPYAALGIRAGSFLIMPAVELSAAYATNPSSVPGGGPAPYFVVAPELHAQSDWSRHSLTADIISSYTEYGDSLTPSLNRPYVNSKIDGRLDVTRQTQINLEGRFIVDTDYPGSPNLPAGLAKLPIYTTTGGTLGVAQQFNRLDVSLKGTADRSTYNNSVLTDGESLSNDDRNYNQFAGILRLGYEVDPGMKPFVEVSEDTRVYDLQYDSSGFQRDSNGTSVKVGGTINVFGSLTGEMAVGYLQRDYQDPTLPTISGAIADGSLIWQATALTTAKLTAASTVSESTLPGVSGEFSRDFSLQVDHALRYWLVATLIVGYERDKYVGSARDDNRYFASAGLTYKLSRSLQLKTTVRQDWLTSTVSGVAYNSTSALIGLRLQR